MSDFATAEFLTGLLIALGAVLMLFVVTWVVGRRIGRFNVVDTVWGLGFATIAATSYLWSIDDGDGGRRLLVLLLTATWGVRLAVYLGVRSRGKGEDPRYEAILSRASAPRDRYALTHVFLPQALIAWFVSLPVQVAMYERSAMNVVAWAGTAVWAVGVFFEAVGDAQLAAFKRDPANQGHVMDRGLWRYTRHPNYFGDACVWFGLWLIAAQQWQGIVTVLSPVAMTWFVAFKTGKPLLEKQLARTKPGYADYIERTSGFFPLPPSRSRGRA